jgi:hypothetical protein
MTHITGMNYGYNVKGVKPGDIVIDADSGDITRAYDNGQKLSLWHVGNIYQPATNDAVQAIVDSVAVKLGALSARCN